MTQAELAKIAEPKAGDNFYLTGNMGEPWYEVTILRILTISGVSGFAIHKFEDEYRVSHVETGSLVARGGSDGEAFTNARKYVSDKGGKEAVLKAIKATKDKIERMRRGAPK